MITQERLKELFRYDPETGEFIRLAKSGRKGRVGDVVGTINKAGYVVIGIDGVVYYAHRLAWRYMTGGIVPQIDHADGSRANNKWRNLRHATHTQNILNAKLAKNNTSGFKGVTWHKGAGRWPASLYLNGSPNYLGLFDTPEDAHAAYMRAATNAHPEFARSK